MEYHLRAFRFLPNASFHKESVTAKRPSSFWDWNLRNPWKNGFIAAIKQIVHALFDQGINCCPMP
jgi:hypothetical protein